MSTLTKEKMLHHTVLRESFMAFCEQCFYILHQEKLIVNYHHKLLASELEDCRLGKNNNLVINMPPRELKSEITSIFYPIWLLAQSRKQLNILIFTRSKKLGKLFLYHITSLLQNKLIETIFPNLRLVSDHYDRLETTKGRIAISSPNVPIIGMGGDVIIIDDPITVAEASDIDKIRELNIWFSKELLPRLNNKSKAKIILLMQRLHRFDLSSYMLYEIKDSIRHLNLEVIATKDTTYAWQEWSVLTRKFINKSYQRNEGDILNEARDSLETMKKLEKQLGRTTFEAQYQQSPKLYNYKNVLCKTSDDVVELVVKDAMLCINLSVKDNEAIFLASLQEDKSNKIALIDYKVENFDNLQSTLDTYVKTILESISSSCINSSDYSRLRVLLIFDTQKYDLNTNELNKFGHRKFGYGFVLVDAQKFTPIIKPYKYILLTHEWGKRKKTLLIKNRDIEKELINSLSNEEIDDFFELLSINLFFQLR